MGIYFRDILLISISRGANNCGQHALEKNIYFIMRFSPHFQLFYFSDRLEFCEFFEWKIKRINNADLFSQTPFLTFIKGANISGGHCIWFRNITQKLIQVHASMYCILGVLYSSRLHHTVKRCTLKLCFFFFFAKWVPFDLQYYYHRLHILPTPTKLSSIFVPQETPWQQCTPSQPLVQDTRDISSPRHPPPTTAHPGCLTPLNPRMCLLSGQNL